MEEYFCQLISESPELADVFKKAVEEFAIQNFDSTIMSRLRRVYYSSISGILYLLGEPNIPSTHGNKMELLAFVLDDEDYEIVHGQTRSSRSSEMVDTSWIEVRKDRKVWIYDVTSMLKFEKSFFDKLESPKETNRVSRQEIISHPAYQDTSFKFEYIPMIIAWFISRYETNEINPHYKELQAEIKRYKKDINYSKAIREYHEEMLDIRKFHEN